MISFHETMQPLVERAAVWTAHKWPSYVQAEDVQQELWIWAYGSQKSIERALRTENGVAKVYSTMLKVASSAASAEDRATNGYSQQDTYTYSIEVLETLLESAFTYEDWQSFATFGDGQPHAKGQVNETGDVMAMLSDVKAGIASLKKDYREVLYYKFGLQYTHQEFADARGITKDVAHGRHKRALNALQKALGRQDLADLRAGWDNRRDAISSAQGRALMDKQYEG